MRRADASAECRALGALSTFAVLTGYQSAVPERHSRQCARALLFGRMIEARCGNRSSFARVWEVVGCKFQVAHQRLKTLRAEMRDHSEGAVPRFHIHQKTNIEVQWGALYWLIGKPGQAVRVIEKAAQDAMETGHGLTHAFPGTRNNMDDE